ncbi:helix-turn-helix domain-containing protein [Streptococcus sp. H31]|uniref:helix-turn-helix domain-containing protein n=1 Tax=Streptococcus huangxiaojuni TaxID=3237239 RepID=UPI0034A4B531
MKKFGRTIKYLRLIKKLTREELCGDETELSVRQLARIESGESAPTLNKIRYIAKRLGVTVGELTDGEGLDLPARYEELKYLIMRTPIYADTNRVELVETYFDEVYEQYYDNLPEEEQLAIDILQSSLDVQITDNIEFGSVLLQDYFEQVKARKIYSINDLLIIGLYFYQISSEHIYTDDISSETLDMLAGRLILQTHYIVPSYLFLLRDVLLQCGGMLLLTHSYRHLPAIVQELNTIINKTQDYQKKPLVDMLEWKYYLYVKQNFSRAQQKYQQAVQFSTMIDDAVLKENLEKEWHKDTLQLRT